MTAVQDAVPVIQSLLWLHFVVFLRMAPVMALFPGLGERSVPARVKLALAFMLTIVVAPSLAPQLQDIEPTPGALAWLVLTEAGVGLLLGIGFRLFLLALQTAGSMAAQATSLSQILDSAGSEPMPAIGHLLVISGLALAVTLGLHVRLTELMILTYSVFPISELPEPAAAFQWGKQQVAGAFGLAFTISAPFVIVSVLYNITLGIINRAMPQLMVVFVGAPAITCAGLVLLLILGPVMLTIWVDALHHFLVNPFGGS